MMFGGILVHKSNTGKEGRKFFVINNRSILPIAIYKNKKYRFFAGKVSAILISK